MTDQFPDATKMVPVPPPELVARWKDHWFDTKIKHINLEDYILAQAAQYGADQELEACCEVLDNLNEGSWSKYIRVARRPKPPSLKEQALEALDHIEFGYSTGEFGDTIRRALEALPNG